MAWWSVATQLAKIGEGVVYFARVKQSSHGLKPVVTHRPLCFLWRHSSSASDATWRAHFSSASRRSSR